MVLGLKAAPWRVQILATISGMIVGSPVGAQTAPDLVAQIERYQACPAAGHLVIVESQSGFELRLVSPDSPEWQRSPNGLEAVLGNPASWLAPASVRQRHLALRERLGRPMPVGSPQVLVFETSSHWTRIEKSAVATRGGDGVWRVDTVQELNVGSGGREESSTGNETLSNEQSARLDALIADPCLRAEPVNTDYSSIRTSNQTRWTLEIVGDGSPVIVAGGHSGFGRAGEIVWLVAKSF